MRTKVDKDVKRKEVVEQDPGNSEEKKPTTPPKPIKKVKKNKKAEIPKDAPADPILQEVTPPDTAAVSDGVCGVAEDEVAAAVNSITETPVENNIDQVHEVLVVQNHFESSEDRQDVVSPVLEQVPTSNSLVNQDPVGQNETEIQEAEPEAAAQVLEEQTDIPEPDKISPVVVANFSTYDSIIEEVARGDIIVKTPPRKPPKKRRNPNPDDCKKKEKLNFDDAEKEKKNIEKKKTENSSKKTESSKQKNNSNKKTESPTTEIPSQDKEQNSSQNEHIENGKPNETGAKSRSKRTPKKRKFHDEQEEEREEQASKAKVIKKPNSKSKQEVSPGKTPESKTDKTVSSKSKKSPKTKTAKAKDETVDSKGESEKKEETDKEKKVKKEKSKKSKKGCVGNQPEETGTGSATIVCPDVQENAHCSSDSGIGGTDSEMKVDGTVVSPKVDVNCVPSENGLPDKMETDETKPSEQKPVVSKKKSKSSKPKDSSKEKKNEIAETNSVSGHKDNVEKVKPPKKAKAKKRKSEDVKQDGEKAETTEEPAKPSEESKEETKPASGEDKQADKPSPKKKKKKTVEGKEGEVKKVKKKKKKVIKPSDKETGKENVEVGTGGADISGSDVLEQNDLDAEGSTRVVSKSEETQEGESGDDVKDGSDVGDDESPSSVGESKLSALKREKKILETRECSLCGHKTRGLAALTRHMKRAHQIISKPPKFKCDRCEFDAAKRAVFAKHMILHDVIMCAKCPYVCSTQESLEEHITEEHKNKGDLKLCRLCNRYVRCPEGDTTLEKHMEECKGKVPLVCKECKKEFKYESGLKIHISTHYPDQPKLYTCELCAYQSNYKANLHKHIQNIHSEREKTIKCQECDKMFYKEEHMKRHLRLHSENRPYNCEKCEKTFKSLCAMRNHMESHNPGRPFKCEFEGCTKSFRTAKFLKNHVEESHQMGEKRYHCSTEGCKFSFFKKSHLKRHEITHTGERNYHCTWPDCGKSFRHSDNLKVHQRQHTNEKPIKCNLCSFSCRQRNSLQWHIKRHHVPKEGSEVSHDGSQSGGGENDSASTAEPKVNGVATPAPSNDPCASVKSDSKGIDLYEFNDDDSCDELPVVFRREKPRFTVLTREDLDQLHEAAKTAPPLAPLPEEDKEVVEEKKEDNEVAEEDGSKKEPEKTPPKTQKKKKKKVVANKKTPPKTLKKVKSPKAPKAPKSPKVPSSPRTPKSPKSQGTKKKSSPDSSKKKTVVSKKKVSPHSKKAAASKKKSPAKKKEAKPKTKSTSKKVKSKKATKEQKKVEEIEKDEEEKVKEPVDESVEESKKTTEPEEQTTVEIKEPEQSPKTFQKPQSPDSDGSSPSPHSPHSDRSDGSPLLSDNESDDQPSHHPINEEKEQEPEEKQAAENSIETYPETVPDMNEMSKEEAMSPGQAQQEAIDRSLEENPIIDDPTMKDNHSQPDLRQYSPAMPEEVEKTEEQQGEDEEQRVSSDDEVTNDILLTPPRAPAPPPPQSPSEEEEEEEVMQPVQSPVPVSVPVQEPLSHSEPMSNQPMSQDTQQPLPSVEPPKEEAQQPQPPAPPNAQYPHPNPTPECEKDYLGQYLQDLSVPSSSARDSVPEEPNRLQRLEELAEKPHEDSRDIPRAASVASNVITHTSMQPFHDMSNKRMEILACDRSQEQHYQRDTASALPRLPDPPFDSFNPLNSVHSVSRENNFLRQNDNIFSTQTTGSSFMRLSESEAMRQRMTTPFLPQNDRTAISRLPDTTLRPTNPALLRRPTTMPSTDMFTTPAMTQTMPRNPFTNTWSGQEVRPPWPQAPYLQRTIDRQPNATPATLFAKENYLAASRDFMFDPSRTMTERNMFASLSSPQPQRELAPETFPLELSYFGSHAYSGTATLDYSRPPCGTAPKTFDERYRQTASSAMSDFRGLPQTSSTEMFSGIGVNSSFNLDKYMYTRDPYHPQHVGENTNSAFLTHSTPTQHSVFDREYPHRSLYPHQNSPYPFLDERQYSTAAKLTHSAGPAVNQERDFMPRPNTAENQIPPDPYRCGMLYNVMNRYPFE